MTKLPLSWFEGTDVVQMAQALLGKIIVTEFDGIRTSGRISETEAYAGESDRASHCYGGRRTARTEIMYGPGGFAYVYLCYGIHHLFNVVTNKAEMPQVVLIRAIEPVEGIAIIRERLGKGEHIPVHKLAGGPGLVTKALGIRTAHTGLPLTEHISIWDDGYQPHKIVVGPRIGIDYAKEDKDLPYRFLYNMK